MSTTLREGELQVQLPSSAQGRKFDDDSHGLSHCMKAAGTPKAWRRPIAEDVLVFNEETWNEQLPDFAIERKP